MHTGRFPQCGGELPGKLCFPFSALFSALEIQVAESQEVTGLRLEFEKRVVENFEVDIHFTRFRSNFFPLLRFEGFLLIFADHGCSDSGNTRSFNEVREAICHPVNASLVRHEFSF